MSRPQKFFEPFPNPKNSPLGPQKVEKDTKIKSKSKVRIERNIENESCFTTWVDPKTVVDPYPNPKIANQGPKKSKIPKLMETYKMNFDSTSASN